MSMNVDFSTPLTEQERAYLEARGRYADIERTDNTTGVETPAYGEGDGTGLQPSPLNSSEVAAARKQKLLDELAAIEASERAAAEANTFEGDDEEVVPYEKWKPAELKEELERRKLDSSGVKQVLVDRLYADDEANAPTE